MFEGSIVALVTPMTKTGELDEVRLRNLIQHHIKAGTQGFVLSGTTGEAPTLSEDEKLQLIHITQEILKSTDRKIPIIAGVGTNNTASTIKNAQKLEALGVDACLIVTPYYNKPTQEGLYQHYKNIANNVSLPIILYNVPSRTACDLLPETVARLSEIPNIIGIKEALGDLERSRKLLELCKKNFILLSGDDASSLAFMLQGGKGVISVTANIAPKEMFEMCQAALEGNIQRAGSINTKLMPLHKSLFVESNPIPVKWVMQELGWIEGGIRLPLTPLSEKNCDILKKAMQESGVFNL